VKRFLPRVIIVSLLLLSAGCGKVFVGGAIALGSTIQGSVTSVQLGQTLDGTGGTVEVTFVTFVQSNSSTNVGFCGDQTTLFPLDQTVSVNFNPGPFCATIIVVEIVV